MCACVCVREREREREKQEGAKGREDESQVRGNEQGRREIGEEACERRKNSFPEQACRELASILFFFSFFIF